MARYEYIDILFKNYAYTTGTIAMWGCLVIFFTSFEYIRRYHFEVFLYSHIIFGIITVFFTLIHYPTCFVFFLPATFAWIYDRLVRTWKSWFIPSSFVDIDVVAAQTSNQEGIMRITVENCLLSKFYPGQYIFAAMIINNTLWERCHWHPFTVSEIFHVPKKQHLNEGEDMENQRLLSHVEDYQSIVNNDNEKVNQLRQRHRLFGTDDNTESYATIHIKALGTKTQHILDTLNDEKKTIKIYIDGLYGPRLPYQDYRFLGLFATGIGVTPALVIMKDVIDKRYQGMYSVSVNKSHLVWSIRHTGTIYSLIYAFINVFAFIDEIEPFLDLFRDWIHKSRRAILDIQLHISIYVTRMQAPKKQILSLPEDIFQFYYGIRPNVKTHMDIMEKENVNNSSVWTHVCGAIPFTRDVINQAVDHGFAVHHETFEF